MFVAVWWAVALLRQDFRLLPTPDLVLEALVAAAKTGALQSNLLITMARVAASFFIAMTLGSALGILLGMSRTADRLLGPWVVLFLNLPALVIIILCYVWFGLIEAAAVAAVSINKIPNVAVTLREGAAALSRDLAEMAAVYRFGRWKTLRHVILPQLSPYFAAAARSGLALVWKIVLVVELLGRPNGVGFELQTAFQLFDVATILAYALAFGLIVQAIELGIIQPWERAVNRWRR
ncbi:ABC transporter permease [Hansschlegelia beijingensis]|uniref:NitT/TauT family transport system permease protein n=1 Tax=Hansschlegelia beijingensis TaxID=1133344 RepID=A0A7W6CXU7_9HYPH|nr:ABC transporter permease [Hansschlegelia beijingensis]MBB3972247.1 NitT/TauT family transport system permease protein [Hansschlegelia beijingensis]